MKVLSVETVGKHLTIIDVQLEQSEAGLTNEVYVRKTISSFLRKQQLENKTKKLEDQSQQHSVLTPLKGKDAKPQDPDQLHADKNPPTGPTPTSASMSTSASGDSKPHPRESFENITKFGGIISHLEKKFLSGTIDSDDDSTPDKKRKHTDNYDLDDPFINDSQESEHQWTTNIKTKHSGFFVSAGDLEVQEPGSLRKPKSREKVSKPTEKIPSQKKSHWEPCEEAAAILDRFYTLVEKATSGEGVLRQLPQKLDAELRTLDKMIQQLHPETISDQTLLERCLETGLGLSRLSVKTALTRVRLEENAQLAKKDFDFAYITFAGLVKQRQRLVKVKAWTPARSLAMSMMPLRESPNESTMETPPPLGDGEGSDSEGEKEDRMRGGFTWDRLLRGALYDACEMHEAWVEAENRYRKQIMQGPLEPKKEKSSLMVRISQLWQPGAMDVSEIRRQLQTEKCRRRRYIRKSDPPLTTTQRAAAAIPVTGPKRSTSFGLTTEKEADINPKRQRLVRPCKAVEFDDAPEFDESHFGLTDQNRPKTQSESM